MKLLCALLAFLSGVQFARCAERLERPNIIFIYADDLRYDAIGAVQREQGDAARWPWLQTPHMDRLFESSIRYRQSFVVNSLCSPGRACIMTGLYSHTHGIINNSTPLPVETETFAKRLQQHGYRTGYCGKWHMGKQQERPGYDFVASFVGQGKYQDCPLLIGQNIQPTSGWVDDVTTSHALTFLEASSEDTQPFFLWLGFKSPHGPRGDENLPDRARQLFDNKPSRGTPNTSLEPIFASVMFKQGNGKQQRKNSASTPVRKTSSLDDASEDVLPGHLDYMRHVAAIDECIGRIIDQVDGNPRLRENTVVMLTSDNGYYLGEHSLGDKRSAYDESLRVPLLVRLPEASRPEQRDRQAMVLNVDCAPTILELAGATPLERQHGRSFAATLDHDQVEFPRKSFLYEYFKEEGFRSPTILAVRSDRHKLITYPEHPEWVEVFDLSTDPYETTNLAENVQLRSQLESLLEQHKQQTDFEMLP